MRRIISILIVISLTLFAIGVYADSYPSKNIVYQVTFSPGGASDIRARQQQPILEQELGVKILVQYKPGGGGSIGWANLVKQKPDGYFMSGINIPHIILQPLARKNAGYQTEQILPIILFQEIPIALTVRKDSPFKTLEDLVNYAKANPGAVTVGGSGTWDATNIAHLQFEEMAGINALHTEIVESVTERMTEKKTRHFERGAFLLTIAYDLKRVGDRTLNIAERIVFVRTGALAELDQDD